MPSFSQWHPTTCCNYLTVTDRGYVASTKMGLSSLNKKSLEFPRGQPKKSGLVPTQITSPVNPQNMISCEVAEGRTIGRSFEGTVEALCIVFLSSPNAIYSLGQKVQQVLHSWTYNIFKYKVTFSPELPKNRNGCLPLDLVLFPNNWEPFSVCMHPRLVVGVLMTRCATGRRPENMHMHHVSHVR